MTAQTNAAPPRARLAFRVGIVGHRPNRLPQDQATLDDLRRMLRSVLEDVKSEVLTFAESAEAKLLYAGEPPILRVVSPLAEGSDRMFAEEAIDLGFDLLCPMPFFQADYETDFQPPKASHEHSVERFRDILRQADERQGLTIFELDGERSDAPKAYGAAGRVVLNQSDLLIAVWDGGKPAGGGGTVETLLEAVRYHVPVLWIDSNMPQQWQLLHMKDDLDCLQRDEPCIPKTMRADDPQGAHSAIAGAIKTIVAEELGLPKAPPKADRIPATRTHASEYFRERKPRFNFAFVWKLFRDLVAKGVITIQNIVVHDFEEQIRKAWPILRDLEEQPPASGPQACIPPSPLVDWVNSRLRPHYAWADKRGDMYADAYRSGYVLTYLLSAVAVFMALLPMAARFEGLNENICVAIELSVLLVIVLLLVFGNRRHWHERWMEYRLLAELIRQIRFLIPLGGGRPFPRAPIHLGVYENLDQTWMYWQMRAIARACGVPPAKATAAYVGNCLQYLDDVVRGQFEFHQNKAAQSGRIGHRLHTAATWLFVLTIAGIAVHLAVGLLIKLPVLSWLPVGYLTLHHAAFGRWLVLMAATLPALGAALSGIANQGEFARMAKRSAAMKEAFEQFARRISALRCGNDGHQPATKLPQVIPLAAKIAEVMVDEVADWRVVVTEHPPGPA